ncbi:hypothetical protein ARMGADRAFT_1005418 [Armillaria gallica]|uniref:Uncharacterized protein n=1 Tax=Armillaria gallica TaxID=47427 RepID=A0A2H3E739_ARMGA|nr:hypothetical protein ARMGADRAFT_1005418 [Armillaria gallica]
MYKNRRQSTRIGLFLLLCSHGHRIFRTQTRSTDEISERTIGETPAEKIKTEGNDGLSTGIQEGDFPDGGLRAWLVIVGVSEAALFKVFRPYRLGRIVRLCAARFQHSGS